MIKYDPTSIYNRAVGLLQQNPDWRPIINESVISALLKSNAEINAETARYAEYLFKESKWDTAQNKTSIMAMANMLGYRPKRKVSSTGKIYVSIDPKMHLLGKTISVDKFENLKESRTLKEDLNWIYSSSDITISTDTTITDSKGHIYTPINEVILNANTACVEVDLIQGTKRTLEIKSETLKSLYSVSKLNKCLYIPFKIVNCENASSVFSRRFFSLTVNYNNSNPKPYRIVDSLLLSDSMDYDVEVYNDPYDVTLFYAKFNNDPMRGPVLDLSSNSSIHSIVVNYIETLGEAGNISNLYENFTISTGDRKLYGTNISPILGGSDYETAEQIKENATKFYINNYSIGTVESYEKTILNTSFYIGTEEIKPKKVIVYGGIDEDTKQPTTSISFISDNLEDIVTSANSINIYNEIENSLNYYLSRLKSPQDVIKFEPPNYVGISVGADCVIDTNSKTESLAAIQHNIQDYVDSLWGSDSNNIDFGNSFFTSELEKNIMNRFTNVKSVSLELEAIQKLNWGEAERINTKVNEGAPLYTLRVPYRFSPIFLGSKSKKGFKDMRVGSSYLLRMDIMYKKPTSIGGTPFHKSIFVGHDMSIDSSSTKFYAIQDNSNIWDTNIDGNPEYTNISGLEPIKNLQQVDYVSKVYTDNAYQDMVSKIESNVSSTVNSASNPGALDDYIIYFSGSYDDSVETSSIGDGWVELGIDSIYRVLSYFAAYSNNADLQYNLELCPLNLLKCNTLEANDTTLDNFLSILSSYVDIYISMRPIDSNLRISSKNTSLNTQRSVIYIDSKDSGVDGIENLTPYKKNRMISINCEYEGN